MSDEDEENQFYCPSCGKLASANQTLCRKYSFEALRTSYFLCGKCRLFFISKKLVRKEVSEWWRRNKARQKIPFKYFYNESIKYLTETVWDYHKNIGYKLAYFKKGGKL